MLEKNHGILIYKLILTDIVKITSGNMFQVRKLFTCTGFVTRALFLLAAAHSKTPLSIVTSLTVAVGFGGLAYAGFRCGNSFIYLYYLSSVEI